MSDQLVKNMDLTYSVRMIRLLKKPWSEWTAFKLGILDGQGEVVRNPKTPEELEAYSPFHRSVRHIKRRLNAVPYMSGYMNLTSSYDTLRSRYNLTEYEHEEILLNLPELRRALNEEMVAGDSGGDPEKIAKGETSGAVTNTGPAVMSGDRKKKRKRKIMVRRSGL
ncbi:major capsid protein [Pantoea phage Phynn]|nr:major capsid protein [Pantoea phage Phynn]